MGAVGDRTGISSFYISFVLAPLASNASELIAAFNYSLKKTSRTIVISFAALQVQLQFPRLPCRVLLAMYVLVSDRECDDYSGAVLWRWLCV